jgi:tRNA-dihydrouridine synthase
VSSHTNMNHGFWGNLKKPFFVLAPMADVTDVPFRTIVARCGRPDVFYTEFVSAHGLMSPGRDRLMKDLALTPGDHPIVAQFFGTKPEHLHEAGRLAREHGFDGVDINMGCPDRSIMKQGAGIALCSTPELAQDLVHAVREGFQGPVAVKTRLGLYRTDEMEAWIPKLLEAKPDVLIVHGRTMKEASKVPAHWDLIGRAAQWAHQAGVLCIGNGNVLSRAQGTALAEHSEVDGIMVGRGIFHNPWLFGLSADREHTPQERLELLLEHTELWLAQWNGFKSFDLMKKFYKVYVSGWPGSAELRAHLMECRDPKEVRTVVAKSYPLHTAAG